MDMNCSSALNSMFRFDSSKWLGRIISIAYTKAYDYLKKGEYLFLFKCTRNSIEFVVVRKIDDLDQILKIKDAPYIVSRAVLKVS